MSASHNHMTRDIKARGKCPACDEYHDRRRPADTGDAGCLSCTYMDGGVYCSNDSTCPRGRVTTP